MITSFVFVMMLVIEYINVQTSGMWQNLISKNKWKQYVFAALLGAIPGCLGAFTAVALFSHRLISFGAIVATMIATSGDEAFVMFAMIPKEAFIITIAIFIIAIFAGYFTDKLYKPKKILDDFAEKNFPLHKEEECKCFQKENFFKQLLKPSFPRIALIISLLFFLITVSTGFLAGKSEFWIKITILLTIIFSLFIVISVPEHFLKKHLWEHIVKMHIPRIFMWTFATLLVFGILMNYLELNSWISENMFFVLIFAIIVGIIPESGPHLIFITLFAEGTIPLSILLASSISQDGHGMLPLLAESKRGFLAVKFVNVVVAFIIGLLGYISGF
ncbi:MAG: arsenic efflux protein [Bacteroidales bacterium]|nr:arsenic efflux protein [Bacteroidales bacterium]MBN2758418.1 arsenic efflux protein [Bacteroidales bacterium]